MSLQVWLPLTKDLRQQGLSNIKVENHNATLNTAGKLGSCYYFNGSQQWLQFDTVLGDYYNNDWSIACWLKPTDSTRSVIISEYSSTGASNVGLELTASRVVRLYWNGSPDINFTTAGALPINEWTHLTVTKQARVVKVYFNGELKQTYTNSSDFSTRTSASYPRIGDDYRGNSANTVSYQGYINDFRMYDHCLSPMEVKELAKGLVLHYPLSSQFETGQTNKYSSPYSDGQCNSSSFTRTKLSNERGYNYKLTRTGTGNSSWPSWNVPNYSFTVGKTYYYSVKIRCNKWTSGTLTLRASRSNNDWVTRGVVICSPTLADGKWHEYYTYQTVNETYDRSGTTVTSNPVLEFYCSDQKTEGTVFDMDFDVKDVQVVESDCYVPFIENSFVGTTVYDCSGFCNNGIRTGTSIFSTDCPKYQGSMKLTSGNKIVATSGMANTSNPTFTCNFWVKMPSATYTTWADIITFPGSATIRMETSNTAGTSLSWYNYPIGTSSGIGTNGAVNNTDWNMFTLTCDGTNWKTYKNGVLANTTAISGTAWTPNGTVSIGDNGMYAQLSDVRIYATALSADDVKSLYQNSAYIDSSGNIYGAVHTEV